MNYWLLKSEPETFSWQQMCKEVVTKWDGVRNYQARNNMQAMRVGDLAFFYHSGAERSVVGIVEVVKEFYPDVSDEEWNRYSSDSQNRQKSDSKSDQNDESDQGKEAGNDFTNQAKTADDQFTKCIKEIGYTGFGT